MGIDSIDHKTRYILWGLASGRCQYSGCNEKLYIDPLTQAEFNQAYVAHIVASSPDGPRGDVELSPLLKADITNLMLLCDRHHRLIDVEDVEGHTVERLKEMKIEHEDRINLLTSIKEEKRSNVILYGANIGNHDSPLDLDFAHRGMIPHRFPADSHGITLSLVNNAYDDSIKDYWQIELGNLEQQFERRVSLLRAQRSIKHYSVFGLAPQPLLIKLGSLLGDIYPADVYQLKKEPEATWQWLEDEDSNLGYRIGEPENDSDIVALKFSVSASIEDARVHQVLGEDCSIWELTIDEPNNDCIRTIEHLSQFRTITRSLLDQIKIRHGEGINLHVFPAMPVSAAVELGRVRNPKSQLPLVLYDENKSKGGFMEAFEITN